MPWITVTMIVPVLHVARFSIHRLLSLRPKPAHPDSSWFKLTCELSVRAFCNLRYCSHTFIVELQDWQMGQEGALSQMLQTFQNLAPMLDTGLKLSPNPAAPKRQRRQDGAIKPKEESSQQGHGQDAHLDQQKLLILMAKLLLRVDRDLQVIHRETTFIFYFSCKDPKGVLPLMLQEAETWHQASTENASTWKRPLRQVLLQTLLTALTTRVHKLLEAPEDSPLMEAAKSSQDSLGEQDHTIHGMEPAGTEAPGLTEDARQSGQNERALSGTPGRLQGSNLDSEVPPPPPLTAGKTGLSSDTMETSDVIPGGQDLRTHAPSCVLPGLDALGHQSQAAQPVPEFPGGHHRAESGTPPQGTGEREAEREGSQGQPGQTSALTGDLHMQPGELTHIVSHMVLTNPNNWCFCNAAAYSLFWTVLNLSCYTPELWGRQCHEIMRFLGTAKTQLSSLATQVFFQDLTRCWGRDTLGQMSSSISQQDSSSLFKFG